MSNALRTILTFFAFVATYFFVYWLPLSLVPGIHDTPLVPQLISILFALASGYFVWKKTVDTPGNLASRMIVSGIIVGAIGFIVGFFGPLIFTPESNLGPLLGIFITGPAGFIVGLVGGAVSWRFRVQK